MSIESSASRGIVILLILSVGVSLASYRFFVLGPVAAFPDFSDHLDNRWWAFMSHVGIAPLALFCGALQFASSIRNKFPAIHRNIGRVYVFCVLVGSISGLLLAVNAVGGIVASVGFSLLSVAWLAFTVQGWRMARARRFSAHRRWMIRSFALTFAAVTLRLYLPLFIVSGVGYAQASVFIAWISWVPNLLFAQWFLLRVPDVTD